MPLKNNNKIKLGWLKNGDISGDMSNIYKQGVGEKNIEIKNTGGYRSEYMHGDTEWHEFIISSIK